MLRRLALRCALELYAMSKQLREPASAYSVVLMAAIVLCSRIHACEYMHAHTAPSVCSAVVLALAVMCVVCPVAGQDAALWPVRLRILLQRSLPEGGLEGRAQGCLQGPHSTADSTGQGCWQHQQRQLQLMSCLGF